MIVSPARVCAALALVAAFGGCGSSSHAPAPATGDFVGRVSGSDAFVAVVVGRASVVAYVCDGRHGIAELFTGSRSGDRVALRSGRGARLRATVAERRVTGAFTPARAGASRHFGATPAHQPAGFYRARGRIRGASAILGWVVLPDGSQRGSTTIGSRVVAAPALNPATSTATLSGGSVSAVRISGASVSRAGQIGTAGNFGG